MDLRRITTCPRCSHDRRRTPRQPLLSIARIQALRRDLNSLVALHDNDTPTPMWPSPRCTGRAQKTAFTSVTDLPVPLSSGMSRDHGSRERVIVTSVRALDGGHVRTSAMSVRGNFNGVRYTGSLRI